MPVFGSASESQTDPVYTALCADTTPQATKRLEHLLLRDSVLGLVMGSQAFRERAHLSPALQVAPSCHGGPVHCSQVHSKDDQTAPELVTRCPNPASRWCSVCAPGLQPQEEPRLTISGAAAGHTAELPGQKVASIASLIRR